MLFVELGVLDDVIREHLAVESAHQDRHLFADVTASDDADRLSRELTTDQLPPFAGAQLCAGDGRAMEKHDRCGDDELGDGASIDSSSPAEKNAALLHRVEIDHVEPDTVLADRFQLGQRSEEARIESLERGDRAI